jgi:hypothetical protein
MDLFYGANGANRPPPDIGADAVNDSPAGSTHCTLLVQEIVFDPMLAGV